MKKVHKRRMLHAKETGARYIFIFLLSSLQGNGFGFLDYVSVDRVKSAISAGEM